MNVFKEDVDESAGDRPLHEVLKRKIKMCLIFHNDVL